MPTGAECERLSPAEGLMELALPCLLQLWPLSLQTALTCEAEFIPRAVVAFNIESSLSTNNWTPEMHSLVRCWVLRSHTRFLIDDEVPNQLIKANLSHKVTEI